MSEFMCTSCLASYDGPGACPLCRDHEREQETARVQREFADAMSVARELSGGDPIELGLIGRLADNECRHGRLAGDRTEPCGCFERRETSIVQTA